VIWQAFRQVADLSQAVRFSEHYLALFKTKNNTDDPTEEVAA
jgi:hypothetical protein